MMEKEILARRQRMQELNSQAQDLVDAGHFDPNAVEETRIVMEERFVRICLGIFSWENSYSSNNEPACLNTSLLFLCRVDAMAAPLSEKGVELERTLGFFQFNRDVDDEEVRAFRLGLHEIQA